jgi:hypothetical protein
MINLVVLLLLRGVVEVELLGTNHTHDSIEDTELTGSEGTDHDATGSETLSAELEDTDLLGDVNKARDGRSITTSTLLVDLGQESISGVRDDGGGNTSNNTRAQGDGDVLTLGALIRRSTEGTIDGLSSGTLNGELSHGVGNLLEEDGTETSVEAQDTISGEHARSTSTETLGEGRVSNGADTNGLERAEEEISDELSHGRGSKIDGGAVVPSLLLTHALGKVNLEELNTTKLEPTLDEVSSSGGTET